MGFAKDEGDGKLARTSGGFWGGKRRIHLNTAEFSSLRTPQYWAIVYLHEATHKYGWTDDHCYVDLSSDYLNAANPYGKVLSTKKALNNADSYAHFIYEVWHNEAVAILQDGNAALLAELTALRARLAESH